MSSTEIRKFYFMYHPVCWSIHDDAPPGSNRERWLACLAWEKRVNELQKSLIRSMKPDEALLLFPVSTKPPMVELEEFALGVLGPRCVIVRRDAVNAPASWSELPNPFERLADDETLEGRAEFLKGVPAEIQAELADEISEACKVRGSNWNLAVLKVIYYSRLAAMDIQKEFQERGIRYDPATVESEAFGEGFEQCAMTWKAMLVPYLGFASPAFNNFELSVTGAPFIINATFKERIDLPKGISLFLWEGDDGRPIGFYARAWCRLRDPQYCAHVPVDDNPVEVWGLQDRYWPGDESRLTVENGKLKVPVLNAIRRDAIDEPCYIIGDRISMSDFRGRLLDAEIKTE